jgi:hypothetical protein
MVSQARTVHLSSGGTTDCAFGGAPLVYQGGSSLAMTVNGNTLVQGSSTPSSFSGAPIENPNVGISFKIVALPTTSRIDISIRRPDLVSTGNSLAFRLTGNVGKVIKLIAGVASVVGIDITLAVGGVIEIRTNGSTVEVLKNGAVVDTITNGELPLLGLAGLTKNTSTAFAVDEMKVYVLSEQAAKESR